MFSFPFLMIVFFGAIGILIPRAIQGWTGKHNGIVVVLALFVLSILGATITRLFSNLDISTGFIRIFLVIGVADILLVASDLEFYRRVEMRLQELQVDRIPKAE